MTLLARPDAPEAISDRRRNSPDRILIGTTVLLALLGLLMIYSAAPSWPRAQQLARLVLDGAPNDLRGRGLDPGRRLFVHRLSGFRHLAHIVYGVTVVLLALVFLPGGQGATMV